MYFYSVNNAYICLAIIVGLIQALVPLTTLYQVRTMWRGRRKGTLGGGGGWGLKGTYPSHRVPGGIGQTPCIWWRHWWSGGHRLRWWLENRVPWRNNTAVNDLFPEMLMGKLRSLKKLHYIWWIYWWRIGHSVRWRPGNKSPDETRRQWVKQRPLSEMLIWKQPPLKK